MLTEMDEEDMLSEVNIVYPDWSRSMTGAWLWSGPGSGPEVGTLPPPPPILPDPPTPHPTPGRRWPKVVLRHMQGKPYEIADLMRVSVYAAHHVMVLGLSRRAREADSQVITMP